MRKNINHLNEFDLFLKLTLSNIDLRHTQLSHMQAVYRRLFISLN